jgi:hypothetical protein
VEILFNCSNLKYHVMLRHEASGTDENGSSFFCRTGVLKRLERIAGLQ